MVFQDNQLLLTSLFSRRPVRKKVYILIHFFNLVQLFWFTIFTSSIFTLCVNIKLCVSLYIILISYSSISRKCIKQFT